MTVLERNSLMRRKVFALLAYLKLRRKRTQVKQICKYCRQCLLCYQLMASWYNLCSWAHDLRLLIAVTNEPKSAQQGKQGAY